MPNKDGGLPVRLIIRSSDAAPSCGAAPQPGADASVERWTDPTGYEHGYSIENGDSYLIHLHGAGHFAFSRHSDQVYGVREPGVATDVFAELFRRQILPFVLQRQRWEVLHACGLVAAGTCIALCGDSQMGKSTLAHAWSRRGGRVFADDAVPFRVEGGRVLLRPIPFRLRLRPPTLQYYGPCDPHPGKAPGMTAGAVLGAIYLLDRRLDDEEGLVRLEPAGPEAALAALLRQAYCLTLRNRDHNRQMIETYLSLMGVVPTFHLSYPTGLDHVETILDRVAAHIAELGDKPAIATGVDG
jgi:hypothetical protein